MCGLKDPEAKEKLATTKNPRNGLHEEGYLLNDERPQHMVYYVLVSLAYGSIGNLVKCTRGLIWFV